MQDILNTTGHRPTPLPKRQWAMTQRWNDLLFAHWPVPAASIAPLLPAGLVPDTFDGSAWIGVVPFWMDRIRFSALPKVPGTDTFPELNLRTYVREEHTNLAGVYFFSLDAANPIAVSIARMFFRLPYYWAHMAIKPQPDGRFFTGAIGISRAGRSASAPPIVGLVRRSGWRKAFPAPSNTF